MLEIFFALIFLLMEMAPYLLLGFFVAGILHVCVPGTFYRKYLSENNFSAVLGSVMLGVPLPLCSCGVIPTAISLRKEGVSRGAVIAFLIATPQTGVDSILATGSLLGWSFAFFRPLVAIFTGLAAGILGNQFASEKEFLGKKTRDAAIKTIPSDSPWWKEIFRYGFVEMMADIGKWLVVGLILAAMITVLIPDGFFSSFSDNPWLGMFVVLLVSIPMYVCATGSIPIAVALMLKGFSPGAAFVFLMAGPATNLASILLIGRILGRKILLIYLTTIVTGAVLAGTAIDQCCPPSWFVPPVTNFPLEETCCQTGFWLKLVCALLLVGLLVHALFERKHSHVDETVENKTRKTFQVNGMTCSHCRALVEHTIRSIPNVTDVSVDLEQGEAMVEGDVSDDKIVQAVSQIGFVIRKRDPNVY